MSCSRICSGMARFAMEPPLDGSRSSLDMVDVDSVKWDARRDGRGPRALDLRRESPLLAVRGVEAEARARATTLVVSRARP